MTTAPLDRLAQRMSALARAERLPVAFIPPPASPSSPPPERIAYSTAEAAAALGVCVKTLRTWGMPTVRIGGRRLILAADLACFLAARRDGGNHAG